MKKILSSLLFTGFVLMPFCGQAAPAEPQFQFFPASAWRLSDSSSAQGGASYQECHISTAFNNGFTLQITGAADWVSSIDLDFKQDLFVPGDLHQAQLKVPGLNQEYVSAIAQSPSRLHMEMSGNDNFYVDMRNSAVLDFQLDDNLFRFYMVGLSNQAPAFEKCMAGATVMARSGRPAVPVHYREEERGAADAPPTDMMEQNTDERRARIISDFSKTPYVDHAAPPVTIKKTQRKRFIEIIEDEMKNNPSVASGDAALNIERVRTIPVPEPAYRYEDERMMDLDNAPNWDAHKEPNQVQNKPETLQMPPDFYERP